MHVRLAPLRLETGRYERLSQDKRTCFNCVNEVESEDHVLLFCPLYSDIRETVFENLMVVHYSGFTDFSSSEKLSVILGSESLNVIKAGAKICYEILNLRCVYLYR
jgi:hypothetical protein